MIGLLKQKNPANILVLFLTGILLRLPYFKSDTGPILNAHSTIFYKGIVENISKISSTAFFFAAITYLVVFIQALMLNRLINDQRMMQRSTYLPATSYLLVTALVPDWNYFSAPLLLNFFILVLIGGLLKLYNREKSSTSIFNLGLTAGLSVFLFYPSIIFLICVIFGIVLMRPLRLSEWLICLLGFTAPFYFFSAYLIITDQWSWNKIIHPVNFGIPLLPQNFWIAGSSALLIIPFLIGGYYIQENLRRMLIQIRKNWTLFLLFMFFTLLIPLVNNTQGGLESWILITIPFAAFHACAYLYPPQKFYPVFLFWITILFIIASQYFQ